MKLHKTTKPMATGAPDFFSPDVASARRFYLDLKPPRLGQLAVVCGGVEHCSPQYSIQRTTFPFYALEYVARGTGQLKLKGKSHSLRPGVIFSYGPGVPHDISGDPAAPLIKYFVDFAGQKATELLGACKLKPGNVAHVFPPDTLSALFDEIIHSGLHLGPGNAALCARLLECLSLKIAGTNAPLKDVESLAFATYKHCRRHVEQKFLELRTLEQIARECHTDQAYLCRLFRRYDHQSPYQYLLRLKMNHAAERLQQSSVLIKQVAAETGFADAFHFSRVFHRVLGISPVAFRALR